MSFATCFLLLPSAIIMHLTCHRLSSLLVAGTACLCKLSGKYDDCKNARYFSNIFPYGFQTSRHKCLYCRYSYGAGGTETLQKFLAFVSWNRNACYFVRNVAKFRICSIPQNRQKKFVSSISSSTEEICIFTKI